MLLSEQISKSVTVKAGRRYQQNEKGKQRLFKIAKSCNDCEG